jgi:hypothetical protein
LAPLCDEVYFASIGRAFNIAQAKDMDPFTHLGREPVKKSKKTKSARENFRHAFNLLCDTYKFPV